MKCEIGRFGWSRPGNAAAIEPVLAIRPEKSLVALLQVIVIRQCAIRRRPIARANGEPVSMAAERWIPRASSSEMADALEQAWTENLGRAWGQR